MQCSNPAHFQEPLCLACVDPACGQPGLICSQCEIEAHKDHNKLAAKHLFAILQQALEDQSSGQRVITLSAQIDSICLNIRSTLLALEICNSPSDRTRTIEAINSFSKLQRQELENNSIVLVQLLKAVQSRNATQFNELFRSSIHRFESCSDEKAPLKRLVFVRCLLRTAQSVQESIDGLIKSNSSLSAILGCFSIRERPAAKFRFSDTNKGKTIKLLTPYSAIMESSGSERMIMLEPSLQTRSTTTKWRIQILKKKSWIGVGMCHINTLKKSSFNFEYTETGHGNYLISSNGYSWSSLKPEFNSHFEPFTFDTGDVIELTYSPKTKRIEFQKVGTEDRFGLDFQFRAGDPLHPAVNLTGVGDSVEVLQ